MQSPLDRVPANGGQAPAGKTVKTVTGQFIAKATVNYGSWQRAEGAVRWLRGELQIKPTVKQAAEIFRVNAPLMKAARERSSVASAGSVTVMAASRRSAMIKSSGLCSNSVRCAF
jgi:hypothetical protein